MNVILLDNVENLGVIGDLVHVKPGYGRNYLLPKGKAVLATKNNVGEFEARREELEKTAAAELSAANARADLVRGMELIIPSNAGPEGRLFGSVGPVDVVDAFEKVGVTVARAEVRLADGPIHEIGEHTVGLHLHPKVNVDVTVRVVAEE